MARAPVTAVVVLLLGVPLAAEASPILNFLGGEALGASDVETRSSYEVRSVDGSCATPVSGCEGVSDFAFPSFATLTAAQAFVDHSMLDRGLEQLDTHQELQAGCDAHVFGCAGSTLQGNDFRPDFLNVALSANAVSTGGLMFDSPLGTQDIATPLPVNNGRWAAWMPPVALIATLVLTGSALVSLRLLQRRRRSRGRRRRRVR